MANSFPPDLCGLSWCRRVLWLGYELEQRILLTNWSFRKSGKIFHRGTDNIRQLFFSEIQNTPGSYILLPLRESNLGHASRDYIQLLGKSRDDVYLARMSSLWSAKETGAFNHNIYINLTMLYQNTGVASIKDNFPPFAVFTQELFPLTVIEERMRL